MTLQQREALEAFVKVKIYYPGKAKRFQDSMKDKIRTGEPLSPSSWQFLRELLHTYRRQIPHEIHKEHCPNGACIKKMEARESLQNQLVLF